MHRWSTNQVDPNDRFDCWREVRAKGLFGATAQLDPEQRPHFSGEFSLRRIGSARLIETDDASDPEPALSLVHTLVQLALIERGLVRPNSRHALGALRVARLSIARRLIAANLSVAELSPASVACKLGISIRHLHVLFESSNMSFSQTVTAQRIAQSRRLLREQPERSVAEIASASGFESLATFYRAFQAANGMTPGDFRATQGGIRIAAATLDSAEVK